MRFKLMTLFLLAAMAWSTDQVIATLKVDVAKSLYTPLAPISKDGKTTNTTVRGLEGQVNL
jgi:hypothetical protein